MYGNFLADGDFYHLCGSKVTPARDDDVSRAQKWPEFGPNGAV